MWVKLTGINSAVALNTDNLCTFDPPGRKTICTQKSIQTSVAILRLAMNESAVSRVRLVRSRNNPADALTKEMGSTELIKRLENEIYHPKVAEWLDIHC
ncbi:hypothetical protein FVE85_9651 [Porphyridium purpureum]|uniref:Uncharacterized protein n=1 Tax=Porphyridium purpureum TaxID=35688 RepID=A0A5J4YLN7_PORPP|nr:hypothetical protein FVE85_9651 [Porphyridium purpureum]|eukprot:POR1978..scf246_12